MITYERVFQIMQNSMSSLHRGGLLEQDVTVQKDTVLLGSGSQLDSIGLVSFVTDLEDRLSRETNQDIFLIFNSIHEFNADNPMLTADTLAHYIIKQMGG